jgi:hypothetical protein
MSSATKREPVSTPPALKARGLLNRCDTAAALGMTAGTLAWWASIGRHRDELPFTVVGGRAYYRQSDIDRYIESRFTDAH